MARLRVRVPATSANLGPGFDCLGLAVSLHNVVEMATADHGLEIAITGEGVNVLPADASNAVARAAEAVFARAGRRPAGLRIGCTNGIPPGSGLGSSAAALAAGAAGANALIGEPLTRDEVLQIAAELEGHPDNVSAALLGGLTASAATADGFAARRLPIAARQVAVALPDVQVSTRAMRAALPPEVPLSEAAGNIGRAVLVAQALASGDFDLLRQVMFDRLHEPIRRRAIPGFAQAAGAARLAGAAAVAISGAGPALIAFPMNGHADRIADAMVQAFQEHGGVAARGWALTIDTQGAQIEWIERP